jgi:uncharacterized protein YdcH (DUF465 family)
MIDSRNAFASLENMQWRDVILPVADWEHRFAHEKAEHHIIYRNGVAIDQLGSQGRTFSYLLPMKQGIARKPFHDAFVDIYFRLYSAFLDKSADTLIDPVHGAILACPGEFNATATTQDGLDGPTVRVTFIEDTPSDGVLPDKVPSFSKLTRDSNSLDDEVAVVPWDRPTPILPTSDPLSILSGILQQGSRMIEKTQAHFMAVADRANEVEEACEDLDRKGIPGTNALRLSARKLRVDSTRLANTPPADVPGLILTMTTEAPKTITDILRETGMDMADLLKMNAGIAKSPIIPAGTQIFVTRKRRRRR